jgi:hypothetical protein
MYPAPFYLEHLLNLGVVLGVLGVLAVSSSPKLCGPDAGFHAIMCGPLEARAGTKSYEPSCKLVSL